MGGPDRVLAVGVTRARDGVRLTIPGPAPADLSLASEMLRRRNDLP